MKKIIALVLAIVMMASMSVVAFAATDTTVFGDESNLATGKNEAPVEVIYDVRKGYIVVIPADFNLTVVEDTATGKVHGTGEGIVSILKARLDGKELLTVTAKGNAATVSGYNWVLKDKAQKAADVGYHIAVSGNATAHSSLNVDDLVQTTGVIVQHDSDTDAGIGEAGRSATLTITTAESTQSGYFQDTITFTANITAKTTPSN